MVSKTIVAQVTVGSNPTPSAIRKQLIQRGSTPVASGRRRRHAFAATGVSAIVAASLLLHAGAAGAKSNPDVAIQKETVLKRSDLPQGWKAESRGTDDLPVITPCEGLRDVNEALRPISTKSPSYVASENTRVSNSVVVLKSSKLAKGHVEPYREPDAATCLEALMKRAFTGPLIATVRVYVTPTDDVPRGADEAAGFEIQVAFTTVATAQQPSQTGVLYYDVLVARVGRALTNFTFLDEGQPLPDQGEFVDAVIGRLQGAL